MNKFYDENAKKMRFFIPIDGQLYETPEDVYVAYVSMNRRERYLKERSKLHESSYDELINDKFRLEDQMVNGHMSIEEQVFTSIMIEKMLSVLPQLSNKEKWIIQNLFFEEKSEKELAKESGIARTTIQSRKYNVLKKIKELMEANQS